MREVLFLDGDRACAMAAIRAGCRFFAGYPITPASEIAEYMAEELPKVGGVFVQMEDEIASIMAALGASWAGLKAMTATSGPGFSLMAEAMGFAAATETPIVVVDAQRAGPATGAASKPWQGDLLQAKWSSSGDYEVVAIYPYSVQEVYELTVEAFNLAEQLRAPVVLLLDAVLAHTRERLRVPEEVRIVNRKKPSVPPGSYLPYAADPGDLVPPMANFGEGYYVRVETTTHDEKGSPKSSDAYVHFKLVKRINDKIRLKAKEIAKADTYMVEGSDYLIVATGFMARIAKVAVRELREEGVKVGLFRPVTIWPFPYERLSDVASKSRKVLVLEMNYGQLYRIVSEGYGRKGLVNLNWLYFRPPTPDEVKELIRGEI